MSDAAVTEAGASYLGLMRAADGLRHWLAMTLLVGARARVRATCTKVKAIAAQRLSEVLHGALLTLTVRKSGDRQ